MCFLLQWSGTIRTHYCNFRPVPVSSPAPFDFRVQVFRIAPAPDVEGHLKPANINYTTAMNLILHASSHGPDDEDALVDLVGSLPERVHTVVGVNVAVLLGVEV